MSGGQLNSPAAYGYPGRTAFEPAESDPAEDRDSGWLISFVDILTLLVTLLVLMLALSHVPHHEQHRPDAVAAQPRPATPPAVKSAQPPAAGRADTAVAKPAQTPPPPAAVPKPAPLLTLPKDLEGEVQVVATATQVNLVIKDDVLYDVGSADLKPSGRAVLDKIARVLNQNDYPVSVEGHTDNTPIHTARFPSNWELSAARATNVIRYLIQQGVARGRLSAVGYADTRPLAGNDNAAGRAQNRRVSVVVHVRRQISDLRSRTSVVQYKKSR